MTRSGAFASCGLALLSLLALTFGGDTIAAAQPQPAIQRTPLQQQDLPIPGYQLVMNLVEIPAGVREVRHTHPGLLAIYVLEGTIILEHEGRPTATYKAGDSFHIDAGKIHQGINSSNAPVKLVTTLIAEKGKPLNTPAP